MIKKLHRKKVSHYCSTKKLGISTFASVEVWNGIWKKNFGMEWSMEEFLWYEMEDGIMEKTVGME